MIREFEYYLEQNLVKKDSPDKGEAESLINNAFNRLKYIEGQSITEDSATFIFEDVYESMREAIQSLMSLKGYKPYSHEAMVAFLIKFYKISKPNISSFDRYRILRNKAVYKAERVSAQTCKEALIFLKEFLPILEKEYEDK